MKYWVLYNDGHCDDGDHGWESFNSQEEALAFIARRLAVAHKPNMDEYVVIKGERQQLKAAEVVTRVEISGPHED